MINPENVYNENWRAMAEFALHHARQKKSRFDYLRSCQNLPRTKLSSVQDRERILDSFISEKLIICKDEILSINTNHCFSWLAGNLNRGCKVAWDFLERTEISARIYDDSNRKDIGLRGEQFIVDFLNQHFLAQPNVHVDHVSEFDDTAGFDVEVLCNDQKFLLEIKTTVQPGSDFRCFLSRNEFRVSQRFLPFWLMVLVRIEMDKPKLVGHLPASFLTELMPLNEDSGIARWESVSLKLSEDSISEGIGIF